MTFVKTLISISILLFFLQVNINAEEHFSDKIPGSYLISEKSGNNRLWTFTKEGTILGTSSAQQKHSFSNQQGTWRVIKKNEVKATLLNFGYNKDGSVRYIGKLVAIIVFNETCETVK